MRVLLLTLFSLTVVPLTTLVAQDSSGRPRRNPITVDAPGAGAKEKAGEASRPNLLFVLSDDQRSDLLGCAGHPILKTPVLDELAARGVRFENMFVTTSICAASRATILTGHYERSHRYTFGTPAISNPQTADSYPAVLRRAGFRTGFIGKFGVSVGAGETDKMFDVFRPLNRSPYLKKQKDGSVRHVEEIAGDHAIQFIKETKEGEPFCLSISFNAPHAEDGDKENHYPWPKAVDGLYDDVEVPAPRLSEAAVFESQPEFLRESMNRDRWFWRWDTPEKYQKNVRAYFRMISGNDRIVGRVLEQLEEQGLAENTVVIFTGDNGYYLGQRGFAGKWSHYEESLRVPLIIFDPRLPAANRGKVVSQVALNVDLAPTILDLVGVKVPGEYQGHSLAPLVRGEEVEGWRKEFFCEHLFDHPEIPKWEGVRGSRYVYANYFQQEPAHEFLHDLKTDPDQLKNLATDPEQKKTLQRMRRRADKLRSELGKPYSLENFPTRRSLREKKEEK